MTVAEIENLKRFFLGELSDADARVIDLRIISEPEFEADVLDAEERLVEEYLDGDLSADRRALFEANFLSTPERIAYVEIVAQLRRRADERRPVVESVPEGVFERFRAWLGSFGSLGIAVSAAALILVTIGLFWSLAPAVGSEIARINSVGANPKFDKELAIGPGEFRGAPTAILDRAGLGEIALLRLAFPFDGGSASLVIQRDGIRVASLSDVRVVSNEIHIFLPRSALEAGSYKIVAETQGIPPQTYVFTVK